MKTDEGRWTRTRMIRPEIANARRRWRSGADSFGRRSGLRRLGLTAAGHVTIVVTMANRRATAGTVAAGQFKAQCLKIMDEVALTGKPVVVTKRGKPVVRVAPVGRRPGELFGALRGTLEIVGDVVAPTGERWDAES